MSLAIRLSATLLACMPVLADTLHTNGPVVTNPTGGTGTIAGQPISNCDGFTVPGSTFNFSTTGVAATVATNTALADDFVVPQGGWDLDALTIYAFQTSQTTASVTQVHVNLWTETPYSAGSPDAPTSLPQPVLAANLTLPAGPGTFVCHRQSVTSTGTVRPVFSYTVSLDGLPDGGRLAPGRYWIQWSCLGATSPSANVLPSPCPSSCWEPFLRHAPRISMAIATCPPRTSRWRCWISDLARAARPTSMAAARWTAATSHSCFWTLDPARDPIGWLAACDGLAAPLLRSA
jgi:hypothetical protein